MTMTMVMVISRVMVLIMLTIAITVVFAFRNLTGVSYVVECFCGEVSWAFLRFVLP